MERIGHNIPSYMPALGKLIAERYDETTGMEYGAHFMEGEDQEDVYVSMCHEDVGQVTYYKATVAEAYMYTHVQPVI